MNATAPPSTNADTQSAAPYTAYSSVKTAVKQMREHGLPGRVDRSVLTNFSGAVVSQLLTALRFLRLIDADGKPLDGLRALVGAIDDEARWAPALDQVLRFAYKPVFDHDLESVTPIQFSSIFKGAYPGTDDVLRKSRTFFLNAAQDANIPISKYVLKHKKPRAPSVRRKMNRARAQETMLAPSPAPTVIAPTTERPMEYQLLDLMDEGMTEEQKGAVWTLISYLKTRRKGTA